MNADVAQTNLVELDPLNWDEYKDSSDLGSKYAPPSEGKYFATAPIITDSNFTATREGYLKCNLEPFKVLNPGKEGDGYEVKYQSLSAKKYKNREGSQMADFLRACGVAARPATNDQMRTALKMCSGRRFQFGLVWEAYNKITQESTSGMENFPIDPQDPTKHLSYINDPYEQGKRWFANGRVKYFVSAIGGNSSV